MLPRLKKELSKVILAKLEPERGRIRDRVTTLATGAILLTFTFVKVVEGRTLTDPWILKVSWIGFAAAVLAGLVVHLLSLNADARWLVGEAHLDCARREGLHHKELGEHVDTMDRHLLTSFRLSSWTLYAEYVQLGGFGFGVFALIGFMWQNF